MSEASSAKRDDILRGDQLHIEALRQLLTSDNYAAERFKLAGQFIDFKKDDIQRDDTGADFDLIHFYYQGVLNGSVRVTYKNSAKQKIMRVQLV